MVIRDDLTDREEEPHHHDNYQAYCSATKVRRRSSRAMKARWSGTWRTRPKWHSGAAAARTHLLASRSQPAQAIHEKCQYWVRISWCVVRSVKCVMRAAWCVVRGAWCVVCGAWWVVGDVW